MNHCLEARQLIITRPQVFILRQATLENLLLGNVFITPHSSFLVLKRMPPKKQSMNGATIDRLIAQRVTAQVAAAMAEYETLRNSSNGREASGMETRIKPVARGCT